MCKYNSHFFWENVLLKNKDPWQSCFGRLDAARDAIFVNTVLIDYSKNILDNNWACYPDTKSLLGFLQYIYLPLAFYHVIHRDREDLYFPVCSSPSLIEHIRSSGSEYGAFMEAAVTELNGCWELEDSCCAKKLLDFCSRFNAFWKEEPYLLHIGLFLNTFEIAQHVMDASEFIEVLEEDIGLTASQLFTLCKSFYTDTFTQKNFVNILNHKIGCIV